MDISKQPTIYIFLGLMGSGKSYFSRNLSEKLGIVRLNSDAMRTAIFGSREKAKEIYHTGDRTILNSYVFNAFDYATGELLKLGQSVIQDANHNERKNRINLEKLAETHGGRVVLVHVITPRDIAAKRAQERESATDQNPLTVEELNDAYARHLKTTDLPEASELVVTIDGTKPFSEQFNSFLLQMEQSNV